MSYQDQLNPPQDIEHNRPESRVAQRLAYAFASIFFALLMLLALWPYSIHFVHAGEAGVLYRRFFGGTVVDRVYGEGFHLIWPWDIMSIYNVRIQARDHEFIVLTTKGLPIKLKLTVRYYPEGDLVALLHQSVGPEYVDTIIIPQIESVLRKTIGQYDPEVIYTTKHGVLDKIILQALEEAGQNFVIVDDVIIRAVELPTSIRGAIEEKLVFEQKLQAYQFRLAMEREEAARKEIEANGIRQYQEVIAKSLGPETLQYRGIEATERLANSANSKVVVIGPGEKGLPLILGGQ